MLKLSYLIFSKTPPELYAKYNQTSYFLVVLKRVLTFIETQPTRHPHEKP